MMDILRDKKLIIGSMLSIAVLLGVFLFAGYVSLPFYNAGRTGGTGQGSCLVLEEQYCKTARFYTIDTKGTEAAVFNLPDGAKLYMPFDGAYFDDSSDGQGFNKIRLGVPDSPAFVIIRADYAPILTDGTGASKGDVIGTIVDKSPSTSDPSDFNVIIYGEDYDLLELFE